MHQYWCVFQTTHRYTENVNLETPAFQDVEKTAAPERIKHNWGFSQYILGSLLAADFFHVMSNHTKGDHRLPHAFFSV